MTPTCANIRDRYAIILPCCHLCHDVTLPFIVPFRGTPHRVCCHVRVWIKAQARKDPR